MTVEILAAMIVAFLVGCLYSDAKLERALGKVQHEFNNVYTVLKGLQRERERDRV